MITINKVGGANNVFGAEIMGLSADEKPIKDIPNGSAFYEIDTQKLYMFDEENKQWIEQ